MAESPQETIRAPWRCPHCGSDALTVFYDERRAASVSTHPEGTEPWPSFDDDEGQELYTDSFTFACTGCGAYDLAPTQEEVVTGHRRHEVEKGDEPDKESV